MNHVGTTRGEPVVVDRADAHQVPRLVEEGVDLTSGQAWHAKGQSLRWWSLAPGRGHVVVRSRPVADAVM